MQQAAVDRKVGLVLIAFAVVWCWIAWATIPPAGMEGAPGPRLFPLLLGETLGFLGLVMVVGTFMRRGDSAIKTLPRVARDEVVIVGGGLGLFILYAFLMDGLGFLLATPIVIILALRGILGIRAWLSIALVAIGLTVGCYLVFDKALEANLPTGRWIAAAEE